MATLACPRCHERVDVPEDVAQARCPFCNQVFAAPETRVTAAPPAPSQAFQADLDQTPGATANIAFELPERYASWEEFRALSPAIQRELLKLATQPLPDLRLIETLPLPEETPAELDDWGPPLGTLTVQGADPRSNRRTGNALIFMGIAIVLGSCGFPIAESLKMRPTDPCPGMAACLIIGLFCFVFGEILRRKKPDIGFRLWLFEKGLLIHLGNRLSLAQYEDVEDFRVGNHSARPVYGLNFKGEEPIVLSIGRFPAIMAIMEYVEIRMSAAQLLPRLKSICEGNREEFGVVKLDRTHFHGPGFAAPWSEVNRVVDDPKNLFVDWDGRRDWVAIRYRDVSFPHLVMAIAHVLIEEHSRLASVEAQARRESV